MVSRGSWETSIVAERQKDEEMCVGVRKCTKAFGVLCFISYNLLHNSFISLTDFCFTVKQHWSVDNETFTDIYLFLQMQKQDFSGRKLKTQSDSAPRPCSPLEFNTLEVNSDIFQMICQVSCIHNENPGIHITQHKFLE